MLDLNLAGLQSDFSETEREEAWREANETVDNGDRPDLPASPWSAVSWSVPPRPPESPTRYVKTKDAERLVKNRAEEILHKVGVQWPSRSTHIRCPLGTHPDNNPPWRWDKDCDR